MFGPVILSMHILEYAVITIITKIESIVILIFQILVRLQFQKLRQNGLLMKTVELLYFVLTDNKTV